MWINQLVTIMFELLIVSSGIVLTIILFIVTRQEKYDRFRRELELCPKDIVAAENEFQSEYNADRYFLVTWIKNFANEIFFILFR